MPQKYIFLNYQNYRHADLAKSIEYTGAIAKAGQRAQKRVKSVTQNHLERVENDEAENSDDLNEDDVQQPLIESKKSNFENSRSQIKKTVSCEDLIKIENLEINDEPSCHKIDDQSISEVRNIFFRLILQIGGLRKKIPVTFILKIWSYIEKYHQIFF